MATIEITDIEKRYGSVVALNGVSFTIGSGEIVGLLGPNGAGKTTLIRILTGYHYPSAGRATINRQDVITADREIKRHIGYLPENAPVYHDMYVYEYLRFIARARGVAKESINSRMATVVAQCGLKEVLFKSIGNISKGYRQRVGLAQAMIHDPDILILDEPTSGLDPNQVIEIRNLILQLGKKKTVILSTHILQEVEAMCERVLIINDGVLIAQGTPTEIASQMKGEARHLCTFYVEGGDGSGESGSNAGENDDDAERLRVTLEEDKQVGTVVALQETHAAGGKRFYRAEVVLSESDNRMAGAALFRWAISAGVTLTSLSSSGVKLEDIFVRLTK